jgi:hypothetical protein
MKWKYEPDKTHNWDQGKKILHIEAGICMGMCVALSSYLMKQCTKHKYKKITGDEVYKTMTSWLNSHEKVPLGRKEQKKWGSADVPKRTSTSMLLATHHLYLLGLTFSLTGGYFTHLSLLSNLSQYFYETVDHAALLYVAADAIVVYEPNWGVALWYTSEIAELGICNVQTAENLLEGGYHREESAYNNAVNVLEVGTITLGKNPNTDMPNIFK